MRWRLGKHKFPIQIKKKTKIKKEREKQVSGSSLGKVRANHINYLECISDPDDPPFTLCIVYILWVLGHFNGFVRTIRAPRGKSINRKSTFGDSGLASICERAQEKSHRKLSLSLEIIFIFYKIFPAPSREMC